MYVSPSIESAYSFDGVGAYCGYVIEVEEIKMRLEMRFGCEDNTCLRDRKNKTSFRKY